jgi:hypothetical protein
VIQAIGVVPPERHEVPLAMACGKTNSGLRTKRAMNASRLSGRAGGVMPDGTGLGAGRWSAVSLLASATDGTGTSSSSGLPP